MQEAFAPDGGYIPRILFAEPSGTLRPDLKNPANQKEYAYFYDSMDKVSMHRGSHTSSGSPLTTACKKCFTQHADHPSALQVRAGMKNALKVLGRDGKAETPEQPAAASVTSQPNPNVSEL